jgi:hypothetical protein
LRFYRLPLLRLLPFPRHFLQQEKQAVAEAKWEAHLRHRSEALLVRQGCPEH